MSMRCPAQLALLYSVHLLNKHLSNNLFCVRIGETEVHKTVLAFKEFLKVTCKLRMAFREKTFSAHSTFDTKHVGNFLIPTSFKLSRHQFLQFNSDTNYLESAQTLQVKDLVL